MPRLSRDGDADDLGASDELIAFKDEGEQEEKRSTSAERDLDDVKSSLVNESESNSGSESEVSAGRRGGGPHAGPHPPLCAGLCAGGPAPQVPSRCGEQSRTQPSGRRRYGALLGGGGPVCFTIISFIKLFDVTVAPIAFWVLWGQTC